MTQPTHIELLTGADRRYRLAVVAAWLLAAVAVIAQVQAMPAPVLLFAGALLVLLRPAAVYPAHHRRRLLLYRNGTAFFDGVRGNWSGQAWTSRWFSVLCIANDRATVRVLVCAGENRQEDYRRLMIWTRFKPFGQDRQPDAVQ